MQLAPSSPRSKFSAGLRTYFVSGWAFLIPYLLAYLLYAWLDSPVNPVGAGSMENGAGHSVSDSDFLPSSFYSLPSPPSLLHVYWALHAIHVMMAGVALWHWWRDRASGLKPNAYHLPLSALAPWLLLALLFWVPGLYLEWPSDPWDHLRRINEWHAHSLVTEHSAWKKSSYFLPYSLTGFTTGLTQLSWLNVYYTAVCLLLSWQYYRLARAVGLGERAAFIFVILQALLMGNNVFSFYRYYGLSSSIFAQLGAVALTRIALEFAGRRASLDPSFGHKEAQKVAKDAPAPSAYRPPLSAYRPVLRSFSEGGYSLIASVPALLALTAFNHPQGLGIAGLGVMAVVVWRLIEWKRSMLAWLILAAVVLSAATVLWFPRHPALDEVFLPQGWLNAAYGFNLFSPSSPAFERSLHILGAFGALNLILGLWLIVRRNHIAGWLTLMPVIALALPCFALPFAHVIAAQTNPENIVTFHRFLFAVPLGLALVAAFSRSGFAYTPAAHHGVASTPSSPAALPRDEPRPSYRMTIATAGLPCALLLALCFSTGSSAYNRLWHSLQVTPRDLEDRDRFSARPTPLPEAESLQGQPWRATMIANEDMLFRLQAMRQPVTHRIQREIWLHSASAQAEKLERMLMDQEQNYILVQPETTRPQTPFSQTGYLSGHWRPQQVAEAFGGIPELARVASASGRRVRAWQGLQLHTPTAYEIFRSYAAHHRNILIAPANEGLPVRLSLVLDSRLELLVEVQGQPEKGSAILELEADANDPTGAHIRLVSSQPWTWAVRGHRAVHLKFSSPQPFLWRLQAVRVLAPATADFTGSEQPATP